MNNRTAKKIRKATARTLMANMKTLIDSLARAPFLLRLKVAWAIAKGKKR